MQSVASSRTSLRSSLLDYRQENGRTYHKYKDGSKFGQRRTSQCRLLTSSPEYNLPNDERENDRLDLQHHIWLLSLDDRLGVSPPCKEGSKVGRVLDVGTGTGIWALNFADEHPEAEVIGNDLSAVEPGFVPPNVTFEVDDVEDEWLFSRPFDFIHSRIMTSSINDWPLYLRRCYENLAPGGYIELQEFDLFPRSDDGTLKPDSALLKCCKLLMEASEKFGRPYMQIPSLQGLLRDVGFVDVTMDVQKWPSNSWPKEVRYKEIGIWQHENMMAGLEAFTMAPLTRAHGWTPAEVQVLLVDVRKDLKDRSIHAYWPA
ncbi:methyltransferase domain-containing protein [Colletotrichum sojae]|uniref:Methyltransferase domain-containing protein n=1 Tax=Colletotrichum sojae TaxID=2175907 RepID=A0A8H6IZV6_9PEZI|nr:methyltransferase domain-containing protein [Colletotrichum sojae]